VSGEPPQTVGIHSGTFNFAAPDTSCSGEGTPQCVTQLNQITLTFDDFALTDFAVQGLTLALAQPTLTPSGSLDTDTGLFDFVLQSGLPFNASAVLTFPGSSIGLPGGLPISTQAPIFASLDPTTGELTFQFNIDGSLNGTPVSVVGSATSLSVIDLAPVVTAPSSQSANATTSSCSASLELTASATSAVGLPVSIEYVDGSRALGGGTSRPVTLSIGTHTISVIATDSLGMQDVASETVTINDETAPAFGPVSSSLTVDGCGNSAGPIAITLPVAQDVCTGAVATVTGTVIKYNGATTNIPIVNGTVNLPPGSGIIQFTAQNANGVSSTVDQTLTVLAPPTFFGKQGLSVDDGASVNGALYAGAGGSVTLGNDAVVGSVFSLSPVVLRDRTTVALVDTSGSLTRGNSDHVGSVSNSTPALPVFPTVSVAFTGTQAVQLFPGTTQSLAPGQYGAVTVYASAKLELSAGTYELTSLDLEPQAQLVLPSATGEAVQLFVRDSVVYRGSSVASGAPAPLYLAYTGTAPLALESAFLGTVVAPNTSLTLQTLNTGHFSGDFFARTVTLSPHTSVVSDPFICP
jgi:hypothetical protein